MGALAIAVAGAVLGATLALALGGGGRLQPALAGGGGATANLIAVAGSEAPRQKFYLVDPTSQVILVYSSTGEHTGFKLVSARYYGYDIEYGKLRHDIRYKPEGYSIIQVTRDLELMQERSRRTP